MSSARYAKISDFCQTGSGTTPSRQKAERYYGGDIPWVKSGELREGVITRAEETVTEAALKETSLRLVPAGALLVAMYGATVGRVGRLGIQATTNQAVCHIVPDPSVADERYMFHALCAKASELIAKGVGGAQPNISQGMIKDTQIYLPQLDEQERIAAILDQADELRRKRQRAIDRLNQLGQAIFYEMFGDPVTNPMDWRKVALIDCCKASDDIRCGPFGTQLLKDEFRDSGVPLWGIKQVNKKFLIPTHEYVTERKAKELSNYNIVADDIVMTRKGTIGNCAVYPSEFSSGVMHSDLLRVRTDPNRAAAHFVADQLHYSRDVQWQIELISGGAIMQGINVGKLKKIEVLLPPFDLQESYMNRIRVTNDQAGVMKVQFAESNTLFESLQHRAFQGEL